MTELLIRTFIKDREKTKDKKVRGAYGTLTSITGAVTNLILFLLKLLAGIFSGSLSIVADAFNNLTDMSSCIVTFLGFRLSGRPADEDHPFGHGRYEYLTGLFIGVLILLVGFEFIQTSLNKIFHPTEVIFEWRTVIILACTIFAKIWLAFFYKKIGKRISSVAILASGQDSLNDSVITGATLISIFAARFSSLPIDGYLGMLISILIMWAGIKILKDTVNPLLGQAPESELVEEIKARMLAVEDVTGVHDLIIHDYGPGRTLASAHAEVPMDADILKIHDAIDLIERQIKEELDVLITIHLDPISTDDEETLRMKAVVMDILQELDENFSIHDFRMVSGETHTNLIFDLVVPHRYPKSTGCIKAEIDQKLHAVNETLFTVITFDTSFIKE